MKQETANTDTLNTDSNLETNKWMVLFFTRLPVIFTILGTRHVLWSVPGQSNKKQRIIVVYHVFRVLFNFFYSSTSFRPENFISREKRLNYVTNSDVL